jgi:hypothetical protein
MVYGTYHTRGWRRDRLPGLALAIRDALKAFKAAVEAGAGFGPTGGKRSEECASLAFRGVKSRLLFQATSCAQMLFSVAQFRR